MIYAYPALDVYALQYPSGSDSSPEPSSPPGVLLTTPVALPQLKLSGLRPPQSPSAVSPTFSSPTDASYASTFSSPISPLAGAYTFPPYEHVPTPRPTSLLPEPDSSSPLSADPAEYDTGIASTSYTGSVRAPPSRAKVPHPYARLYTKREGKRRKMWNHALEKVLFTPQEIATMGAPHRRTIYTASLEAHIDRLHAQLLEHSLFPVAFYKLEQFRGLNSKTAKSMVAGLERDAHELRLKRLELQRANDALREMLRASTTGPVLHPSSATAPVLSARRHSIDGPC